MEIYYINSEKFLKTHNIDFLHQYADNKEFKSQKRFIQYTLGRYLVKTAGEKIYNLPDTTIEIQNKKPKFKYGNIKFSISHSSKIIATAFDKFECGLDIEEMKPRNLNELSKYYEQKFETQEDFYKFWTENEATIKLQQKAKIKYSKIIENKYMLTVVSSDEKFSEPTDIIEL